MPMNKDDTKKAKRIAAVFYVLFMGFITLGSYLSQQQNPNTQPTTTDNTISAQINSN